MCGEKDEMRRKSYGESATRTLGVALCRHWVCASSSFNCELLHPLQRTMHEVVPVSRKCWRELSAGPRRTLQFAHLWRVIHPLLDVGWRYAVLQPRFVLDEIGILSCFAVLLAALIQIQMARKFAPSVCTVPTTFFFRQLSTSVTSHW
jgi:hypothetical protein